MERLAAFRWLTEQAELRPHEVAERAGVSRQTLANLRSDGRGVDYEWPPDLRILLEVGLHGPRSTDQLVESIGQAPVNAFEVTQAIDRLVAEQLLGVAGKAAAETAEPTVYWHLTGRGIEDLPRRLRHAAMPPSRTWTAYVASSAAEANAIVAAGERALGEHGAVAIPAGTVTGMTRPEVAFAIEATDAQAAATAAIVRFGELRARAGMTPRHEPVIVSALIPPPRPA